MLADLLWHTDPLAVKRVIISTVIELFPNAPADLKMEAGRYRYITGIEQTVDVAAEGARFVARVRRPRRTVEYAQPREPAEFAPV